MRATWCRHALRRSAGRCFTVLETLEWPMDDTEDNFSLWNPVVYAYGGIGWKRIRLNGESRVNMERCLVAQSD